MGRGAAIAASGSGGDDWRPLNGNAPTMGSMPKEPTRKKAPRKPVARKQAPAAATQPDLLEPVAIGPGPAEATRPKLEPDAAPDTTPVDAGVSPPHPTASPRSASTRRSSPLAELGYEEPTPIQREAIPPLLEGRDVLAEAPTGTGKTAAFALPIAPAHRTDRRGPPGAGPRALVLVPTRELAMQVAEAVHATAGPSGRGSLPVYGGQPYRAAAARPGRGVEVVVATPGRALDHLTRGSLRLDRARMVVLDEADEMLDMGFAEDLETILSARAGGAADGALLGHDLAGHRAHRQRAPAQAGPRHGRADKRAEGRGRRAGPPGRLRRAAAPTSSRRCAGSWTWRTRPRRSSSPGHAARWTSWARR